MQEAEAYTDDNADKIRKSDSTSLSRMVLCRAGLLYSFGVNELVRFALKFRGGLSIHSQTISVRPPNGPIRSRH